MDQQRTHQFPQDPNFRSRVIASFGKQAFMKTLGARLARVEPGLVEISLPFDESLTQQHGYLHAGAIASTLDSACGYAALTLMPADAAVLTVEYKINLLAPARGPRLLAVASVKKTGKTLMVSTGDIFEKATGEARKLIATMTATILVAENRGLTD